MHDVVLHDLRERCLVAPVWRRHWVCTDAASFAQACLRRRRRAFGLAGAAQQATTWRAGGHARGSLQGTCSGETGVSSAAARRAPRTAARAAAAEAQSAVACGAAATARTAGCVVCCVARLELAVLVTRRACTCRLRRARCVAPPRRSPRGAPGRAAAACCALCRFCVRACDVSGGPSARGPHRPAGLRLRHRRRARAGALAARLLGR